MLGNEDKPTKRMLRTEPNVLRECIENNLHICIHELFSHVALYVYKFRSWLFKF